MKQTIINLGQGNRVLPIINQLQIMMQEMKLSIIQKF